jgi:Leucine-rich repeat (LRR) protein
LAGTVSVSAFTGLREFTCRNNNIIAFTGNINLSGLLKLNLELNDLTGNIPTLSANSNLSEFYCSYNEFTDYSGGTVSSVLDIFEADNNLLTSSAVDGILSAFVVANNTTTPTRVLNLGGVGNQAPTLSGVTNKATLTAIGWTVITN